MRAQLAFLLLCGLLAPGAHATPKVLAVTVDGIVHPVTVEILSHAFDRAKQQNYDLVLVRLNTPGGMMDAMRDCVARIVASPVPVVTYATPGGGRATSEGFFLLEAGDVAAMTPGTTAGAARPLVIPTTVDKTLMQKIENDTAASLRSIVSKRGRNSALAEKAVLESRSFTETEALENKLIELVARNDDELLARLDGLELTRFDGRKQVLHLAGATIDAYEKTVRQQILWAISDPNLALMLLVVGVLCLYIEFSTPGLVAPGVVGAILTVLGLTAFSLLPIHWLSAVLLLLALTLFILEAKFTSQGILGVGGAICMVLGATTLVDSPLPELRIRLSTALALAVPFAAITTLLVSLVVRARRSRVMTGPDAIIGEVGVATSTVAPEGIVFVHGEYWNAVSLAPVVAGSPVRVTSIDRLRLTVKPA